MQMRWAHKVGLRLCPQPESRPFCSPSRKSLSVSWAAFRLFRTTTTCLSLIIVNMIHSTDVEPVAYSFALFAAVA